MNAIRLGRVAGIEIRVHLSWLLALALISWSIAAGSLPESEPTWSTGLDWLMGVIIALGLFASVLLHELGHSLVARSRGLRVSNITLYIFGGISTIQDEAHQPRDELAIAVVGPLTSLALGGLLLGASFGLPDHTPIGVAVSYLGVTNLLLGAFNLLPGFPLDGGRVLRAGIWALTKSAARSTTIASYVGQGVGYAMILVGFNLVLIGDLLDGLWIGMIGWFLQSAAESERRDWLLRHVLGHLQVRDVMLAPPPTARPTDSLQQFVDSDAAHGQRVALVLDGADNLVGLLSVSDARRVLASDWPRYTVGDVMARAPLTSIEPTDDLAEALRRMGAGPFHQLPVVQGGRAVGLLAQADILRVLRVRQELGLSEDHDGDQAATPVAGGLTRPAPAH